LGYLDESNNRKKSKFKGSDKDKKKLLIDNLNLMHLELKEQLKLTKEWRGKRIESKHRLEPTKLFNCKMQGFSSNWKNRGDLKSKQKLINHNSKQQLPSINN